MSSRSYKWWAAGKLIGALSWLAAGVLIVALLIRALLARLWAA